MAYFYLARVWTLRKVVDGVPVDEDMRVGTEATLRYVMDPYVTQRHDGTTIEVEFPRRKYGFPIEIVYGDGDRNAVPPILPTRALMRTETPLEPGDYNVDMTSRPVADWRQLYETYPGLAAHPFTDAPFQPGD